MITLVQYSVVACPAAVGLKSSAAGGWSLAIKKEGRQDRLLLLLILLINDFYRTLGRRCFCEVSF